MLMFIYNYIYSYYRFVSTDKYIFYLFTHHHKLLFHTTACIVLIFHILSHVSCSLLRMSVCLWLTFGVSILSRSCNIDACFSINQWYKNKCVLVYFTNESIYKIAESSKLVHFCYSVNKLRFLVTLLPCNKQIVRSYLRYSTDCVC